MNSMWLMSYEMANKSLNERKYLFEKYVEELNYMNPFEICENITSFLCYYEYFEEKTKENFRKVIQKMRNCRCCPHCCKGSNWWNELLKIEREFQILTGNTGQLCGEVQEGKITVLVPKYLSSKSFLQPPVDMLMCVKQLKKKHLDVNFIDDRVSNMSPEQLFFQIKSSEYVVLTSSPYDHIQNYFLDYRLKYVFLLINYIKRNDSRIKIVLCGAHGSIRPDIVAKECDADYVIKGEYDFISALILDKIINKENLSFQGLYTKESNSYIFEKKFIDNISTIDSNSINELPAYEALDFRCYYGDSYINNIPYKVQNFAVVLASRGCKYNCSFCFNFFGNDVRYREPENVVDEMQYLEKHGVNNMFFIDSTFTQRKEWVIEICKEIIKRKLRINWSAETRCDCIDDDILSIMSKANCKALWFGVESFCDKILRSNSKYNSNLSALKAIEKCKKYKIQPLQFIMIGALSETEKSLEITINELEKMKESYVESAMIATPRFGTKYYNLAKKQYPDLGEDFYSLVGVRGLVNNGLTPDLLYKAMYRLKIRDYQYSI